MSLVMLAELRPLLAMKMRTVMDFIIKFIPYFLELQSHWNPIGIRRWADRIELQRGTDLFFLNHLFLPILNSESRISNLSKDTCLLLVELQLHSFISLRIPTNLEHSVGPGEHN